MVAPDGGLWMSAGSLLAKYDRTGPTSFKKAFDMQPRPHAPWSYPQTGEGAGALGWRRERGQQRAPGWGGTCGGAPVPPRPPRAPLRP